MGRIIAAKDGAPIEGAEVEIRSTSALFEDDWDSSEESTPNGEYKITDITDLPREGFDLFVTSSGHCPQVMKDLKVPDGQTELRVDFTLYETLTLKGVVVSAADNQPIEDASVYASSPDPDFEDDGTDEVTDENGAFSMELDSIPLDGMFVLATADAHAAVSIPAVPAPDRSGVIDLGRIALPAAPHLIGVVVDKATNQPIPGGEVSVYPFNAPQKDEGDFGVSETIDATGRFEMDLTSAPSDAAEILIEAKDCFPIRQRLNVPPGQAQIELRFEVERQIVLTGMVTRPGDQSPVAGARVRLITAADVTLEDELFSRTRPDGTYRIELPAGDVGRFAIVAEYGSKRVPIGKLTASEVGDYKIVRNFTMDVPKLERKLGPQGPENMPKLPDGIRRPEIPGKLAANFPALYQFLLKKWYFDELYDFLFTKNAFRIGRFLWKRGDAGVIDRFGPDGLSALTANAARRLGGLQSGYLYHYACAMIAGIALIVTWFVVGKPG